jgi:hypothetical protein
MARVSLELQVKAALKSPLPLTPEVEADVSRILAIWEEVC